MLRTELSAEEAEAVKKGKKFERSSLVQRFSDKAANYSEVTVSIDGAFFEDGTFVGPNTTNFFEQTKAVIDARRDLLNEIGNGLSNNTLTVKDASNYVEEIANSNPNALNSHSTVTDYYDHFRALYAYEIVQMKRVHGADKGLEIALLPLHKPWAKLTKKQD